ncbi:hypothetical protein BL250_07270 [Erwinia sp. OLTSP20]|uniref:DUF418 domain-containing protein YeiB n=1 Tax=unclassified Erwinia TaxID=2622719 RepID=UPI000C17E3E8|nr:MULTISPECIES: DUF418 domain-containing protein YeiB [unclassified Erwinia]PIJ50578.1 hypothetical protein BV501_08075 [Erwinia sp. OAMSP11]PIJ72896.1 hypothetical protein BK416_08350 [Erwinia sp. OLSSP12]PIJ82226.1 hypothetical protein BLD47_06810 [Erwinia sp. OLCASP19]PIJ84779.1 hypothetical protein BLD46_07205 [Erwinia sp. OLMTSP26]PIJ86744.1 hypothetical protein BLD49_07930 [Erwinia sp. OLMDSP33]
MPRIPVLDFIRGAALLGILLLNIVAFGLPDAAYLNPAWAGQVSLADALSWAVMDLLAQQKFLSVFALLFGAGLYMQLARGKCWLQARLLLLALFGLIHSLFFWQGDILLDYGLIGLLIWRMLGNAPASRLLRSGIMLYVCGSLVLILFGLLSRSQPGNSWLPGRADLQYEQYWHLHGGALAFDSRLDALSDGLLALGAQYGWQLAGLMLIGAALMHNGWLQGGFSQAHYRRIALAGIACGMLINLLAIIMQWLTGWDYRWCAFYLQIPRELSAPLKAIGYLALVFACWRRWQQGRVTRLIAAVGRMALSNYLLQTLICLALFDYAGWFMALDRIQLLGLVPGIWLINLLFSWFWLRHFSRGPLESLWHILTRRLAGVAAAD